MKIINMLKVAEYPVYYLLTTVKEQQLEIK